MRASTLERVRCIWDETVSIFGVDIVANRFVQANLRRFLDVLLPLTRLRVRDNQSRPVLRNSKVSEPDDISLSVEEQGKLRMRVRSTSSDVSTHSRQPNSMTVVFLPASALKTDALGVAVLYENRYSKNSAY